MNLKIQYGTGVIALPARIFPGCMPPDNAYFRVLFALCGDPSLLDDADGAGSAIAALCGIPAGTVKNALSYWLAEGILSKEGAPAAAALENTDSTGGSGHINSTETPASTGAAKTSATRSVLPAYSQVQTAEAMQNNPDLQPAIHACEQVAGKIFSEHETAQLAALYDSYGFDGAFLMTLFAYCKKQGKNSVAYAVRTALGMYDDGIRTVGELEAKISYLDRLSDSTMQIRRMFGLGERALTASEKQYIETWTMEWKMPMEVIRCAYEITIKNIEKPRMSYVNKILSGWHDSGIHTVEAVAAAEEAYARQKQTQPSDGVGEHSFKLDEFLELAMKRSFE